jgi:hypothetical protein
MRLPGFPAPDGGYSVCRLNSIAESGPAKCGTTSVNMGLSQVWSTKGITVRLSRSQQDADCLLCCEIEVVNQLLRPEGWVSPMLSEPHCNRHLAKVMDAHGLSFKSMSEVFFIHVLPYLKSLCMPLQINQFPKLIIILGHLLQHRKRNIDQGAALFNIR